MSTECSVIISGDYAAENYLVLKSAVAGLPSGSAVSVFEASFQAFDASVTECIDELLKTHIGLLSSGVVMTEEKGCFRWMWEGYGDGDTFMVTLLQLFDLLGVAGLVGESHGDEEIYYCRVTEDNVECKYFER